MKVVIDIPDKVYNSIKSNEEMITYITKDGGGSMALHGSLAIINGTILPKGHGKLVDVEDVKDNIRKWRGYLDEDMMYRINFAMEHHIPTIIESDKGE